MSIFNKKKIKLERLFIIFGAKLRFYGLHHSYTDSTKILTVGVRGLHLHIFYFNACLCIYEIYIPALESPLNSIGKREKKCAQWANNGSTAYPYSNTKLRNLIWCKYVSRFSVIPFIKHKTAKKINFMPMDKSKCARWANNWSATYWHSVRC